jgi:YebC/PmpR family DNA-binding regulatory protein
MAGHSKWANIKHTKDAADKKRGKLFSKLARDITVAAKLSGTEDSPLVKVAVEKAKSANMPKNKIIAAIDRGLGRTNSENDIIVENTYEAYAPGGIACLIDTQTDNPNRTLSELRTIVNKAGGKMLSSGSVSWMFDEVGLIVVEVTNKNETENLALELLDVDGVIDLIIEVDKIEIIIQKEKLGLVQEWINRENSDLIIKRIEVIKRAKKENKINSDTDIAGFLSELESCDDVLSVWTNIA